LKRFVGLVLLVAIGLLAVFLIFEAVVFHDRLEEGTDLLIKHVLRLGSPDKVRENPEVISWLRWLLVAAAIALVLIPKRWGRSIWIDVAALSVVVILVYSLFQARDDSKKRLSMPAKPVDHPAAGTVRFKLPPATLADPLSDFKKDESAILLIVRSQKSADGKTTTKIATPFKVTLQAKLGAKGNTDPVIVTLDRGSQDATVIQLSEAVAELERYYVLPPR
jgi:hypothetical protein